MHDVADLAHTVARVADELGLDARVRPVENPRAELEDHYYEPDHRALADLGYRPIHDVETELRIMLSDLLPHASRIDEKKQAFRLDVRWQEPAAAAARWRLRAVGA